MKTEIELLKRLHELKSDDRLYYPVANVFINAPLALIQHELEVRIHTLEWVLNLPFSSFPLVDTR